MGKLGHQMRAMVKNQEGWPFGCLSFPRLLLQSLKHAGSLGFSPLAYGFPGFLLVMTRAVALLTCPETERE